jgi:hypothetical protein
LLKSVVRFSAFTFIITYRPSQRWTPNSRGRQLKINEEGKQPTNHSLSFIYLFSSSPSFIPAGGSRPSRRISN